MANQWTNDQNRVTGGEDEEEPRHSSRTMRTQTTQYPKGISTSTSRKQRNRRKLAEKDEGEDDDEEDEEDEGEAHHSSSQPSKSIKPSKILSTSASKTKRKPAPAPADQGTSSQKRVTTDKHLKILLVSTTPCYMFSFLLNKDFCDFQDRPQSATLQDSDANEVHLGEDMTVYDMEGNPHTFTPHLNVCSHFPGTLSNIYSLFQIHSDHALLRSFYDYVEESYVTDKEKLVPLHVKKDPHPFSIK